MQVRLYRPFPAGELLEALPETVAAHRRARPHQGARRARRAALSSTWSPRSPRRMPTASAGAMPLVIGGRYGLSSKELTPAMVEGGVRRARPRAPTPALHGRDQRRRLRHEPAVRPDSLDIEPPDNVRAVFFGLGSDGTVGANKNTIKILGEQAGLHAQGYFVYDSKKSGSQTISHLRFGPEPIRAPYLVVAARASSAATSSACSSAPTSSTAPRRARRCCSTPATRADRVWDALSRRGPGADPRQAASSCT